MRRADEVWLSMGNNAAVRHTAAVRATRSAAAANKPSTDGAANMPDDDDEEAAAFTFNKGRSRGKPRGKPQHGRVGQSWGMGGKPHPSQPSQPGATSRGDRHPDDPPEDACNQHYRWGRQEFFCSRKSSCPWRHIENAPQDQ